MTVSEQPTPPRSLREDLREFPAAAWILFAGTFVNRFGSFVMPFLVLYVKRKGYSGAEAGFIVGAYGLGHLLAAVAGGLLADSFGRRNTIALSMFSSALVMAALSRAESLPALVGWTLCAGMAAELYRPASSALLADLIPAGKRVTGYAMYRLSINAGVAAGPACAGFLADRSFGWLFAGDALTSLIFGILALAALPNGTRVPRHEAGWRPALASARLNRPFLFFLLASLCIAMVDFQLWSTFPLRIAMLGMSTAVYGLLVSLNGLLIILVELPITRFVMRFEQRRVISTGFLLQGLGIASIGLMSTPYGMTASVVLFTLGEMISSAVAGAYVADLSPEALRGRYMGLWNFTFSIGLTFGPWLGTILFDWSQPLLWLAAAGLGVAATLLVLNSAPSRVEAQP